MRAVATDERELTEPVDECVGDGRLNRDAVGFSRRPLHRANLGDRRGRRKRWEYWCVTTPGQMVNLTVADLDYATLVSLGTIEDLARPRYVLKTAVLPPGRGPELAERADEGEIEVHAPGLDLLVTRDGSATVVDGSARTPRHRLDVALRIEMPPDHETLNVLVPWSDRRYQFTSKQNCRPATGVVRLDGRRRAIGEHVEAFGCQDWGRGRWPYAVTWNWASLSTRLADGRTLGVTVGDKWTDGTGVTENGFVLDGRLTKLGEKLEWTYDRRDWLAPWRIRAAVSGQIDLRLTPVIDNAGRLELGLLSTALHCCFGHFDGHVITDDGERVEVGGALGWAEEHRARW